MATETFTLNNGVKIPAIGLGTWKAPPGEVEQAVEYALKAGYRHIDGAIAYQNEDEVGAGIKASGVPRGDIFLTSKLWGTYHDRVEECLDRTLKSLGTDYLDLYLVHWPARLVENGTHPFFPLKPDGSRNIDWEWDQADTWKQMEAVYNKGKVKAIGVSNAGVPILEHISKNAKVPIAVNQVEIHPYNPVLYLEDYCKKHSILLQAYSPLGSTDSPILGDPELAKIAEKHGVQPATVLISWINARGIVALPKSVNPKRIESNKKIISLDREDVETLNSLAASGKQRRVNGPPWGSDFGFPDWYGSGNQNAPEGARLLAGKA